MQSPEHVHPPCGEQVPPKRRGSNIMTVSTILVCTGLLMISAPPIFLMGCAEESAQQPHLGDLGVDSSMPSGGDLGTTDASDDDVPEPSLADTLQDMQGRLLARVNETRASSGLPPIRLNEVVYHAENYEEPLFTSTPERPSASFGLASINEVLEPRALMVFLSWSQPSTTCHEPDLPTGVLAINGARGEDGDPHRNGHLMVVQMQGGCVANERRPIGLSIDRHNGVAEFDGHDMEGDRLDPNNQPLLIGEVSTSPEQYRAVVVLTVDPGPGGATGEGSTMRTYAFFWTRQLDGTPDRVVMRSFQTPMWGNDTLGPLHLGEDAHAFGALAYGAFADLAGPRTAPLGAQLFALSIYAQ